MRLGVPATKAPGSRFGWSSPSSKFLCTTRCSNPSRNILSAYDSRTNLLQSRYFASDSYIRKLQLAEYRHATHNSDLLSVQTSSDQARLLFARLQSIRKPLQNDEQNVNDDRRYEVLQQLADSVVKAIGKMEDEAKGLSARSGVPTIEQTYAALEARKYRRELLHRIAKRSSIRRAVFYKNRSREERTGFLLPSYNEGIDKYLESNSEIADQSRAVVNCLQHLIAMSSEHFGDYDIRPISKRLFRRKFQTWDDLPPFPQILTADTFTKYLGKLVDREYLKYGSSHRNGIITDMLIQLFSLSNRSTAGLRTIMAYNLAILFAVDTGNLRLARKLVSNMPFDDVKPDVDTLNLLMSVGYRPRLHGVPINRQFEFVLRTLTKMRALDIQANRTSWIVFLKTVKSVPLKLEIIKHMRLSGYGIDSFTVQSFILDASGYLDITHLTDVIMEEFADLCNEAILNVVVHRLLRADSIGKAWQFVNYMAAEQGLKPNLTTLNVFLEGMFRKGRLDWMFGVLSPMVTKFKVVPDAESYRHLLRAALKCSFHVNISTVLQMIYGQAHSQGLHLSRASAMEMLKAQAWFQALKNQRKQLPVYYGTPRRVIDRSAIAAMGLPPDFPEPHDFYSQSPYTLNLTTALGHTEKTLWQACMRFLSWDKEAVLYLDRNMENFTQKYILSRALGIKPISSSETAMSYNELLGRRRLEPLQCENVDHKFPVTALERRHFKSLIIGRAHELLQMYLRQSNTLVREVYYRRIANKAKLGLDRASMIEAKAFGVFPQSKIAEGQKLVQN
ncbi:hypothetical protein V1506DRAFT_540073 [Lipomyces tetrasporus]